MSKMLQVRNVPDKLHRQLKGRAALLGKSLSDYVLEELRSIAEKPTVAELVERLQQTKAPKLSESPTEALRRERDSR